jgi:hypothetical protein
MRTAILFVSVLVPLVAAVVVGVVALVVVRSRPALPAPPPSGGAGGGSTASTWFAQLGGGPGATYGTFSVDDGHLAFVPAGAATPTWVVACRDLWVRRQGVGPFAITAVRLRGPMGEVACNVSREHINRFMTNSAKTFRESAYAGQFVAALEAQGARPG